LSSPTQRTLKHLRAQGYVAQVVEKWLPVVKRRQDLFGFIDVLAIREGEVLGVQSTSGDNVSSRVKKIAEHELVGAVRKAGIRIVVHGWRKNAAGRWVLREVDCS
jgi:carbonic anhydrase